MRRNENPNRCSSRFMPLAFVALCAYPLSTTEGPEFSTDTKVVGVPNATDGWSDRNES